jgi:hypothetical protein
MTPSGIEPATFRLVAQCLNQLRNRVPPTDVTGEEQTRDLSKVIIKLYVPKTPDQWNSEILLDAGKSTALKQNTSAYCDPLIYNMMSTLRKGAVCWNVDAFSPDVTFLYSIHQMSCAFRMSKLDVCFKNYGMWHPVGLPET